MSLENITYYGVNQPRRRLRKEEYLSRKECALAMREIADIVEKGNDAEMVYADIMVSTRDKEDGE